MESMIQLRKSDVLRLRAFLASRERIGLDRDDDELLHQELDRAQVVDDGALPEGVVAIGTTAVVLDLESGARNSYTLVLPPQADISELRVSVLAPLGTALLGSRVGDVVEWHMPGGLRRLRIEAVEHDTDPNVRMKQSTTLA